MLYYLRRPLFAGLLIIIFIITILDLFHFLPYYRIPATLPADGSFVVLSGHINSIDSKNIYLKYNKCTLLIPLQELSTIEATSDDINTAFSIGSEISLKGYFQAFSHATNPGEFDSYNYYSSLGIYGKITKLSSVSVLSQKFSIKNYLWIIRSYIKSRIFKVFPEKEASVIADMLLGDKASIDAEIKALYQSAGIAHILSISSLHVTIIGMTIYKLLRRTPLPPFIACVSASVFLLSYWLLTGCSVSATRACFMFMLRMLSIIVARTSDSLTSLGIIAATIIFSSPYYLHNVSFLLSFSAVLGICTVFPMLTELMKCKNKLLQSLLANLSIHLFTLPVTLYFYYEIPTYSIILNLIILPFMSVLIISALIAVSFPGIGILGTGSYYILKMYEYLCKLSIKLPQSSICPGAPKLSKLIIYYLLLIFLLIYLKYKPRIHYSCSIILALLIIILFPRYFHPSVNFLDVGQGSCIVIRTNDNETYIYDGGSSSRSHIGQYVIKPFLKYNGVSTIDGIFLSHLDDDHINGIEELLNNKEIWNLKIRKFYTKNDILPKEFTLVHPYPDYIPEDSNSSSLCLLYQLNYNEKKHRLPPSYLLLTGDVSGTGEAALINNLNEFFNQFENENKPQIKLISVAHHGSKFSTTDELLDLCKPSIAVISCSKNNRYGHPHKELLERLEAHKCNTLITAKSGAIIMRLDK